MVYAVSDATRHEAQTLPSADQRRRASRTAEPTVSLHWPRVIALGLNIVAWAGVIAAARWAFHH